MRSAIEGLACCMQAAADAVRGVAPPERHDGILTSLQTSWYCLKLLVTGKGVRMHLHATYLSRLVDILDRVVASAAAATHPAGPEHGSAGSALGAGGAGPGNASRTAAADTVARESVARSSSIASVASAARQQLLAAAVARARGRLDMFLSCK